MSGPSHSVSVRFSKRSLALLGAVILVPWALTLLFLFPQSASNKDPLPKSPTVRPSQAVKGNPGPWGELTYTRILTEPPEDHFNYRYQKKEHFMWTFHDYDEARLDALWEKAGLSPSEIATLAQPELRQQEGDILKIAAPRELVRDLSSKARTTIYTALAAFPENNPQNEPFRFSAARRAEWFEGSGLNPAIIEKVSHFCYQRGNSLLFSDANLVMGDIPSAEQRLILLKALARTSSTLVTLHIRPDSDIEALAEYWGHGNRSKDIKPLLQSLQRKQTAMSIDIIHLLPPFPRSLLYTYPSPDDPGSTTYQDCHWSSLNFFNSAPDPRYEDINIIVEDIRKNYHPITTPSKFGDLILFVATNGDVIHSCIYIADDIVFTKNGVNPSTPWILMSLEDVATTYPSEQPLDMQRLRRKATSG